MTMHTHKPKNTPQFIPLSFIQELLRYSSRQLEYEREAARLIKETLRAYGMEFSVQRFATKIPRERHAELFADGKSIPCKSTALVSGVISGKDHLLSSLISSQENLYTSNINSNPRCSTISCSNYYFAPAVAVDTDGLITVLRAQRVTGKVAVDAVRWTSENILVGNRTNPRTIVFAHYDSIESGAIDNASGVAVVMDAVVHNSQTLEDTLYVFSGNEELSYDQPVYWGHGFRAFERMYLSLMRRVRSIIVVDCVGYGRAAFSQDPHLVPLAFPITNVHTWQKKIRILSADVDALMPVYHSAIDDGRMITAAYLRQAHDMLLNA